MGGQLDRLPHKSTWYGACDALVAARHEMKQAQDERGRPARIGMGVGVVIGTDPGAGKQGEGELGDGRRRLGGISLLSESAMLPYRSPWSTLSLHRHMEFALAPPVPLVPAPLHIWAPLEHVALRFDKHAPNNALPTSRSRALSGADCISETCLSREK